METFDPVQVRPNRRPVRRPSRWLWKLLLALLPAVLSLPGRIWADTISDPKIIISASQSSGRPFWGAPFPITGTSFSFVVPSGTSPPCVVEPGDIRTGCAFVNASGVTWSDLHFVILPDDQPLPYVCDARAFFAHCLFDHKGGELTVTFFGGTGIADGNVFDMRLVGWLRDTEFVATASTVPEPASGALFLLGAGSALALVQFRRTRRDT